MTAVIFFSVGGKLGLVAAAAAPVVVVTCIAAVVALIRKQDPGQAALLGGGTCVGLGLVFVLAYAVLGKQSSTCDAFCGTGGRAVYGLLVMVYAVVPYGLASAVSTAIVVATIRRLAR